jgi:hypothetical protein
MIAISHHKALKLLSIFVFVPSGISAQSAPPRKDIPAIAKAANGAIVTIIMVANDKPIAQGTGFLVSADGTIVTNYHVIETGSVAIVKFPDGKVLRVDGLLAANKVRDLAIIKIHGEKFRTLTLGNSDRVQIGEEVVAIGNPLGLELTVSNGILSGIRTVEEEGGKFLQVTAPISHGSSGGPLFNMAGEVIGIITLYLKGGENLNFAIPVNDAKLLLQDRSAGLQNLPNEMEMEPPKETHVEATQAQVQMCDQQAKKFAAYLFKDNNHNRWIFKTGCANHYELETKRCYVEVVVYQNIALDDKPNTKNLLLGRTYSIYDAYSEGDGGPSYGKFSQNIESKNSESCDIQPSGRSNIKCRSEEEFNDLAMKYFGVTHPTTTVVAIPLELQQSMSWPQAMKIAAESGKTTTEQVYEDTRYCYQNPTEWLYFEPATINILDGLIKSCNEVNAGTKAAEDACRKEKSKDCVGFLRFMEDVRAGL